MAKIVKNNSGNFRLKFSIFFIVASWTFLGWPGIKQAQAAFNERTETNAQGSTLSTPFQVTLAVPTGTANGDLMFTWIGSYSATVTTNAAWALLGSYTAASDKYYLYARVASSEPASYVWTFSGTSKYKATCTTYIASSDFNVTNVSTDLTVSNTSYRTSDAINRAVSFNVPNSNSPILFFGGVYSTASKTQTPPTNPGTFTEDYDAGHTTPDFWLEIAYYIWASSGSSGNIDSTISATLTTKHAFAVALKPPPVTLSISVSPLTWGVGTVDTGTTQMSTSGNKIGITNDGNVAETFTLQIYDEDDRNEWTHSSLKTGAGNNIYVLSGIFCATADSPVQASFNETDSEDVLTTAQQTATSTKFAYAGGSANAVAVPVSGQRSLWLRLDMPTAVSGTYAYDQHTVTVRISCQQS